MLGNELKVERVRLQLKAKTVAESIEVSPQQLYNIEKSDALNAVVKYLFFLREKGADINGLFDRLEISKIVTQ